MSKDTDRHSKAIQTAEHRPLTDEERAPIEAANGLRQFDRLMELVEENLKQIHDGRTPASIKPSVLMELNRIAVDKIIANPGGYRQTPMEIGKSKHQPPRWEDVPSHVEEMCEYVDKNGGRSAIHLAAYLLWRVNWIHPFTDGNGRTARAVSYLVLCIRLRQRLPGDRTMPDFIADEKSPYYSGLEAADAAYAKGRIDVSVLERYLTDLLALQVKRAAAEPMQSITPSPSPHQIKKDSEAIVNALGENAQSRATNKAAWITGIFGVLAALVLAGVALSRCGKESRCVLGRQESCPCPGGGSGVQTCINDGLRFTECKCNLSASQVNEAAVEAPSLAAPVQDASSIHDVTPGSAVHR